MRRLFDKLARLDKKSWAKLTAGAVAAALCLGVLFVSAVQIMSIFAERKAAANEYSGLREQYAPGAQADSAGGGPPGAAPEKPWEINGDYVGWLAVPGAGVDYPVVRGTDNARYLSTTFEGNANAAGTIFMDCRNTDGFAARNTILYGHNMTDGSMFGKVSKYLDAAYLAENPTITVTAPDGAATIYIIFAAYTTDAWDAAYRLDFADEADFAAFAARLGAPEGTSRLLTLSTCTNGDDDTERILVHAALAE